MSNPLVTCFMPTRNRREWLPFAIECFELQTYANRELVIVADGQDVRDLIPKEDSRITLVSILEAERPQFLSEKFNLCCGLGKGEILCKWDDDDWSATERIADQVERLQSTGKMFTGYCSMLFTDGKEWRRYSGTPAWAAGTSLCFRREWWARHKFQPKRQVGSDGPFVHDAAVAKQLASVPGEGMMVASTHARNSCPRPKTVPPGSRWTELKNFPGVPGYRSPLVRSAAA